MSMKIKNETSTRTKKLLTIVIAFIFLFTTAASPVGALTEVENSEAETKAVATEEAADEPVEELAKTTDEVVQESDEETTEESGLDYLDNPEKIPGDYPEGEALVCYVKESNLIESPSALCTSLCKEENATKEQEETLTETVDLLENAKTLMTLDDTSKSDVDVENNTLRASVRQSKKVDEVIALVKSDTMSTTELVNALNALPNVDFAHPNYRQKVEGTYYDSQWAYNKEKSNYHMNIPNWNVKTNLNAKDVVVAVLDTGVDYNHEDLKNVMWSDGRKYEKLTELGGGMYGLNTAAEKSTATNRDSTDPMDQDDHGTHCAGIIGAEWNDIGVSGACNGVKIMAIASLAGQYLYSDDLIEGMEYVAEAHHAGVNVVAVNNSWGSSPSTSDCDAYITGLKKLKNENVIAVFAAGNENADTDKYYNNYYSEFEKETWTGRFKAYYFTQQENAIIVGSHGKDGTRAYYSNYGKTTVDVFAPGGDYNNEKIVSTVHNNKYAYMQGTSMACPAITAEVAILRAQYPEASMTEVRNAVRKVTTGSADIQSKCISGGYANVGLALDYLETVYGNTPKHTVTLDPNGGTISTHSITIGEGKSYGTLPTPTRTGYVFDGWYTTKNGGDKITSTTVFNSTEDITIYAHWRAAEYKVTFNANGGSVSPASKQVTYDSTYGDMPTPTKTGYVFDGWYTSSTGGNKIESTTTVTITANQTLYAHWREPKVIYDANGHGTAPVAVNLSYGTKVTAAGALTATGYTFKGWNTQDDGKGTDYSAGAQLKVKNTNWTKGDLTLYAQWEEKTYTLTYDANGHGTSPASTSAKYSAEMKVGEAISVAGYTFKGWNTRTDGSGTNYQPGDTIKNANQELGVTKLYATWEKIVVKHTVTLHLNEGTLVNNLTEYIEGEVTQLPTPTRTNYTFTGWFTNADLTGNKVTSIPANAMGNVEYYAGWFKNEIVYTSSNYSGKYDGTNHSGTLTITTSDVTVRYGTTEGSYISSTPLTYKNPGTYTVYWQATKTNYPTAKGSFTITITNGDSAVTKAPVLIADPTYAGTAVKLVNAGTASNGTMQYAKTTSNSDTAPESGWISSATELTASSAGIYYIWYKVKGNTYYNDVNPIKLGSTVVTNKTYTITYSLGTGVNGTAPPAQTKEPGSSITLATLSDATKNSTSTIGTSLTVQFNANGGTTTKTSATSVTTNWTDYALGSGWGISENATTVSYAWGSNYSANASATLYPVWTKSSRTEHGAVTLPTTGECKRTGYTLLGFSASQSATVQDAGLTPGATYTPSSTKTLYAVWAADEHTVSFDGNGGNPSSDSITVTYGQKYGTLPTATRTGYNFEGWYTQKSSGTKITKDSNYSTDGNQTLYAHWTAAVIPLDDSIQVSLADSNYKHSSGGADPEIIIKDAGGNKLELVKGTDYDVKYKYDLHNSKCDVTITFKNGQEGTVTKTIAVTCAHTTSHRVIDRANSAYDGIAHNYCNDCDTCTSEQYEYFDALSTSYVKKLKAKKSKKAFTVKWKKQSKKVRKKFSHYQIQYGTSPSFYNPIVTVKNSKASRKIKGARKTVYYYRVRTIANGCPSGWSAWKSVKTK